MKHRKKPVEIEAMQYDGTNYDAVVKWVMDFGGVNGLSGQSGSDPHMTIHTLKGTMRANPGDWIIRGVQGESYPCKPDIFVVTLRAR